MEKKSAQRRSRMAEVVLGGRGRGGRSEQPLGTVTAHAKSKRRWQAYKYIEGERREQTNTSKQTNKQTRQRRNSLVFS